MKKKVFSRLIVSLLLLMLITALSATLITASEEDIEMEEASLAKAKDEDICVLQSSLTAYELCALMSRAGLPGTPREE